MSQSSPLHPSHTLIVERAPAWVKGSPWLERLLVAVTGVSISTKIMGIVLALTILLGLAVTLQVRNVMARALQGELHNQGVALARDLADRAALLITSGDVAALEMLLREVLRNYTDSRYVFVLDSRRQLLAGVSRDADGDIQSDAQISAEVLDADLGSAPGTHLHYNSPEGRIHDFVVPIQAGELGLIRLALVESRLSEIIGDVTEQMWLTTLLVAGVGILAALLLTWLLTRPILDLVATTEQLRRGDLSVRAPHWNDDEIGALSDAFNQMVSELEISQQTVIEKENARTHLLSRLISAQEEERKRIARELHDGVGQALTSILVHIKTLAQSQDAETQERMAELRQLVDETLIDVRLLSRELRPSALDDLGLAAALERYVAEFHVRYPQLETDLHCTLPHRLPPNLETSLYRIIQEAMTNTARHSHATSLSVVVSERAGVVHAIVEDNGAGFTVESARRAGSSVGLHSMTERSELLNGTLEIESSDDGTTVYVEIPLVQHENIIESRIESKLELKDEN
jgi:signal transduction histidine kinase